MCGRALVPGAEVFELVVGPGDTVLVDRELEVGRAQRSDVQVADPAVSRRHARVTPSAGGPVVEDLGSSHGTYLDGSRLSPSATARDGSVLRVGDRDLRLQRRRHAGEARPTRMVPAGATRALPVAGQGRPRVRSGWALKERDDGEVVLRELRGGRFLQLDRADADLFERLDGTRSLSELIALAEQRHGEGGGLRLARLLADLGEHGLLDGVEPAGVPPARGRALEWAGAGDVVWRLYERGGWLLFTRAARGLLALLAVGGLLAFAVVLARGDAQAFDVAGNLGLGALVFGLARVTLVVAHELAHGLTMASFGRRVGSAGVRLAGPFPVAFVETSESWFESRGRRLAVGAAGPVSDAVLGGAAALVALAATGTARDVAFQIALGAWLGALLNLNPLAPRDGAALLADALRTPDLRRHRSYRVASAVWLAAAVAFAAGVLGGVL